MKHGGHNREKKDVSKKKKAEIEVLKHSLEEAKKVSEENYDKFVRLNAEFMNFKTRSTKEKLELMQYANKEVLTVLLPFVDALENAMKNKHEKVEEYINSFQVLKDSLMKILEKEGLKKMEVINFKFDPNLHEAVGTDKKDDLEENIITQELHPGYMLKDKVLRHAMVKINKK